MSGPGGLRRISAARPGWHCLVAAVILIAACRGGPDGPVIESNHPGFSMTGGKLYYQDRPFSGVRRATLPVMQEVHLTAYRRGLPHGSETVQTLDGKLTLAERRYVAGLPHGEQRTWHRNGTPRSVATYELGEVRGEEWLWHENGRPAEYKRYDESGKIRAHKRWRRTGTIYMNVVFVNGAMIGMPGSKVCDPIRPSGAEAAPL